MTQDPMRLARIATILLWTWFATDLGLALVSLQQIGLLGGFGAPIATQLALEASDKLNMIAGSIYTLAILVAGISILRWIFVVNRNAHAWSDDMQITPGWNIGWFFVPIANLWKPYQGMSETWDASFEPDQPEIASPILRWWWGLWIITSILGNVTFRLALRADTPDALIGVDWLYVIAIAIDLPLTIVLAQIIAKLSSRQSNRLA